MNKLKVTDIVYTSKFKGIQIGTPNNETYMNEVCKVNAKINKK